ncbi:hypothetical protein A674_03765 [Salmonella enterica subsp. enterica serovar Enteritidis str. 2009K1651]|uniref:Uncharacterized protein n=2 Tax=Salmonella enterica I TaxID=59201 RepID=M7RM72_SALDU|nr:hypothetical protein A670_01863 [Salmonella enterica subsp. enterica serovar Dublin str. UC16]EPI68198.1 hypothetical protein A673_02952 [Salmonella enterica subsp. enterica serovar Enteritidis str. 2009K0958]EPI84094.1 hypothetical protein A674_03765 [Salmonella enterica subsp. enterica serovar Enteritidis str. 2009K1651]EPI96279.1 hypothetical protein A679_03944 [Salmonella enterica subsp. enterica serovar Enteritidis str. 2010K-0284]
MLALTIRQKTTANKIKSYDDLHIYHHQRSYYSTCNQPLAFFCIHHNHFR